MSQKTKLIELMKGVRYPAFSHGGMDFKFGVQHSDHVFELVAEKLLSNNVIALPCGVGEDVWVNDSHWGNLCECYTCSFSITKRIGFYIKGKSIAKDMEFEIFAHLSDFGEKVFLTREEAEKALESNV